MALIDWLIVAGSILIVFVIGLYTQRYLKSVADFMAGGRLAGRYLLCVARGEMQGGAAFFIAMFEVFQKAGLTYIWWQWIYIPVSVLLSIFGFVFYRFRETRALTLAQFFELRYSKKFRLFTGGLGFLAGILNFGIIPAITARFFVYFLGMPPALDILGLTVPTFLPVMIVTMAAVLWLTLVGGQITIMITDCTEGLISYYFYLVIIFTLLAMVNWTQVIDVLGAQPTGQSMLDPFDSLQVKDFNLWFVLMSIALNVYGTMAWQNSSGYNAAALNAHEARMGGLLGRWRDYLRTMIIALWAICAITFLSHSDFSQQAAPVPGILAEIPQEQIRSQMEITVALSQMLPAGVKGMLCALFVMGMFGGITTHLHSWGGILVQDLIVPLRKKPFGPKTHLSVLRWGITGVAVFSIIFGWLFQQTEHILMWWQITTAIFVGGAGSAIIGGLYWKKGTAAGAWAATVTGMCLALGGILLRQFVKDFPLNGTQISFATMLTSITTYVIVSLATCREDFNLDRMLHRGEYADPKDPEASTPSNRGKWGWSRLIGIDSNFTFGDKIIANGVFGWSLLSLGILIVGSIWNVFYRWPIEVWSVFWFVMVVVLTTVMAIGTTAWFSWGVIKDMRLLFRGLRNQQVNHLDDGTVVGHVNLDEAVAQPGAKDQPR